MGGPYAPVIAQLGGRPTKNVDIPICSVFLVAFLGFGISHMVLFRRNLARGHKFIPSAVTFGFCMSRVVANVIRITWACYPNNVRIAIAAQIFVAAGVLLLFILNLLYAQRMLRAALPALGWSRPVSWTFKALYILVVISIIMLITVVIQSMYTLNANTHRIDRDIQLYGATYFAIVSFLPLPIVSLVMLFAEKEKVDSFGSGSWRTKGLIVFVAGTLLCLGASFRAGTSWMAPHPIYDPPSYMHKACFYVFDFGIDISVVILFLFSRVDKRFHVPNGSSKVRHYRGSDGAEKGSSVEQIQKDETQRDIESSSS
ncbi:uncharacterized protein N7496_007499 [Penicillium cataractarum]|uniref:Uncharacterized protein n=1 Tax=Penicillium cataractarum TaxID=2100454 RepID=A0A9W9S3J5_9EURO|nr:uncharacterized protein N7496_007499 [Penicillium cataractarum]KAJ5371407.1 hypothetical protein N7496_007499 [Penicillium cataractarum]